MIASAFSGESRGTVLLFSAAVRAPEFGTRHDPLTDDFVSGVWALRRVIRSGTSCDIAAVRRDLRYLDRLCRRAERRWSSNNVEAA